MGFIDTTSKSGKGTNELTVSDRVDMLVQARGFNMENGKGTFKFTPNNGATRRAGTIANGTIEGELVITNRKRPIVFSRTEFGDKHWPKVCRSFGFQYHQVNDIDSFTVNADGSVTVGIKIIAPLDDI